MARSRPNRVQHWAWAVGVSLAVHLVLLVTMVQHQTQRRLIDMPVVQVAVHRLIEPEKPEPKPQPLEKPLPPQSAPSPRPAEAPPVPVETLPLPPVRAPPAPVPATPAAPPQTAQNSFRLGCAGRAFDSLSREEQSRCLRNLADPLRTVSPGEKASIAPNEREKQFAAEAAANAARNAPFRASGDAKAFGCPEANLGVGCASDREVTIFKQKF
jgi:hypothetical protein